MREELVGFHVFLLSFFFLSSCRRDHGGDGLHHD
jgi:hypothetical protein